MDDVGAPPSDSLVGKTIDGYRIESRIGSGATGIVYRATDASSRSIAIKVLNEHLGRISQLGRRFDREARVLTRLTHPCVVHIVGFGVVEDVTYIAMELLEGETLEDRMTRGPVEPTRVLEIARAVLSGLAFAHEQEIVHRDLKPANIFLPNRTGESDPPVKILDFGLAKFLSVEELSSEATLTRRGRIIGTPAYMSPEQITGVSLDVRADVYASGVVLYELLADRRPFDYQRRSELLRAHLFESVPSLANMRPGLEVHPKLEAIVRQALEKDPAARFANAGEMLEAIDALPNEDLISLHLVLGGRIAKRKRADTSSVVISEHEVREATSSSSDGGRQSASSPDESNRTTRARGAPAAPLGGLPFERVSDRPVAPPRRAVPLWVWAILVALASGTISYLIGRAL